MHPAAAHSLDVAAVAMLLPQPTALSLPRQTLGFLVALHDAGKFSRPFQGMVAAHWPAAILGTLPPDCPTRPKHDAVGLHILRHELHEVLEEILPARRLGAREWTATDRAHVFQALAGHHGRPVALGDGSMPARVLCNGCIGAVRDFARAMAVLFRPEPVPFPAMPDGPARLGWDLAGLVTLADWVGSRQEWFSYVPLEAVANPAAYFFDHALPRAAAALSAAGLSNAPAAPFLGTGNLFPMISPSPVQAWAQDAAMPSGPVLAVIEDATGSGKTEAAMVLAHRMLASGRVGGVFLALPTMATANAMFGRMGEVYRRLFRADSHPSLVLAHGHAELDPRFASVIRGGASPGIGASDPADEPSEIHCASWLAEDRRRSLLAQFGVGTVDQALLAVLPVRHAALRQQGLKGKLLIVDEAHAFDAYMQRELVELLRFHAALGGSAILLSATLPASVRQKLVDAFRSGLGTPSSPLLKMAYPLATLAGAQSVTESACGMREGLARKVAVTRLPDGRHAVERIGTAARAGAAVAWIRNTVDDAMAAAGELRAEGLAPLLFHARFAMVDRLAIEGDVLRRFGRPNAGQDRACVLVATQVVEQSLDIDFDLLCTDLAPVDLLIQRAGRLWRHGRNGRPVAGPELLVVSPEPVDDPGPDWIRASQPGTAAVYRDPALLWRGARAVFDAGCITTPDDMRPMIEAAADDAGEGSIPPGLSAQADRARGETLASSSLARQNVLSFKDGYNRQNGSWEPDIDTPTRHEDRPQVTLRLALVRDGAVVPYAEDADDGRAWSLSELRVANHRVASCPVCPDLQAAADVARSHWGRWERDSPRVLLAVMTRSGDWYTFDVLSKTGEASMAKYHPQAGLSFVQPGG